MILFMAGLLLKTRALVVRRLIPTATVLIVLALILMPVRMNHLVRISTMIELACSLAQ